MKVKKFTASTMQEAMARVKEELGPNAVILQTRSCSKTLWGLFPRRRVEITAAADVAVGSDANRSSQSDGKQVSACLPPHASNLSVIPKEGVLALDRLGRLEDQIAKLTSTVEVLVEKGLGDRSVSGPWSGVYQRLLVCGLEESLARGVIEDLSRSHPEPRAVMETGRVLLGYLERAILAEGGIRFPQEGQRVVVLIGPTGVGKTTTLAKIAAGFLKEGRKIAFLTADTYRLAAVEQLQKYADIMGLWLDAVYSPEEMAKAIARHSDKEIVFVDTAGRSQRNSDQMEELRAFVGACQPAEVHLLLAATTKQVDLEEIIERFSVVPINRLILTKADESTCFGPFYGIAKRTSIPFSYITTGQNVPEDIEEASAAKIARLILYGTLDGAGEGESLERKEDAIASVSSGV